MLEFTYINAGITSATTSMATRLWLYSVSIAMIGYDKIFFQDVKNIEKEKGKREIGDNGMRKEREDCLGYCPIYGLCHRYVMFIVGRLLSHWERYIGIPTTDDLGIFRF